MLSQKCSEDLSSHDTDVPIVILHWTSTNLMLNFSSISCHLLW